jgi:hypothetical protein
MNFTWDVVQMDRLSSDGFVITVYYTVIAENGESEKFTTKGKYIASTYGTVSYIQEDKMYIPYADLTKNQVIGWVQNSLGKDTVEASLTAQIDAQKNPVQESGLPWATA